MHQREQVSVYLTVLTTRFLVYFLIVLREFASPSAMSLYISTRPTRLGNVLHYALVVFSQIIDLKRALDAAQVLWLLVV